LADGLEENGDKPVLTFWPLVCDDQNGTRSRVAAGSGALDDSHQSIDRFRCGATRGHLQSTLRASGPSQGDAIRRRFPIMAISMRINGMDDRFFASRPEQGRFYANLAIGERKILQCDRTSIGER